MLEQMLKKLYENGRKADLSSDSERIKAKVLSRIEMERSMKKQIRIKPLIVAAAVTAVGLMSVVLTVNASVDNENKYEKWKSEIESRLPDKLTASGYEMYEEELRQHRIESALSEKNLEEYLNGKITEALKNGGITVEKELDETDVVGYVPPRNISDFKPEELETVKLIEENPEALGLTPIGKSETFVGGLRIVNRHFENKSEPVDGEKVYYSFRRIYTDDPENRLLASVYQGRLLKMAEDDFGYMSYTYRREKERVLNVILDHTEEGCGARTGLGGCGNDYYDEELGRFHEGNYNIDDPYKGVNCACEISYWSLKSYSDVSFGYADECFIIVKDGIQVLD